MLTHFWSNFKTEDLELWTCHNVIGLVMFFTKIQDDIKNLDHYDFLLREETAPENVARLLVFHCILDD